MKIHNYGNDYVQARKFKEVNNAGNRIAKDEPTTSREVYPKAIEAPKEEEAKTKKNSKKRQNNSDNV